MHPDHVLVCLVDAAPVVGVHLGAHFDRSEAASTHLADHVHDVADLHLHYEDEAAAVAWLQVRAVEGEEVREVGRDRTQVGARVVIAPRFAQGPARTTRCLIGGDEAQHVKARGEHQHVGLALGAVGRADGLARDLGNGIVDQLDAGIAEHPVPAVVHQHPLAEGRIGGQHLVQQLIGPVAELVGDVAGEVLAVGVVLSVERTFGVLPVGILLQGSVNAVVERPPQSHPVPRPVQRHRLEQRAHRIGNGLSELVERRSPVVGALVDRQRLHVVLNFGSGLHAARSIADDRHALARQIGIGRPARCVPGLAAPRFQTVDIGPDRRVEDAGSADDDVGLDDLRGTVDALGVPVGTWCGGRAVVSAAQTSLVGGGAESEPARLPAALVVGHMAHLGTPDLPLGVVADALD